MSGSIRDSLPPTYRDLLPQFMDSAIPAEVNADCGDCSMCQKNGAEPVSDLTYYLPDAKCCTYHPKLPNYLIGALLSDPDPALDDGRQRVQAKIDGRIGVTPFGIAAPRKYTLLYESAEPRFFGRSDSMLCPYFDKSQGNCTVWRHRETVCSTFFCKHVKGEDGAQFWNSLKAYLRLVQEDLTKYVLHETGFPADWILDGPSKTLSTDELDDTRPQEEEYQRIWRDWAGREEVFFRRAHKLVAALTRDDFERITGISQALRLDRLRQSHQRMMAPELPATLKRNPDIQGIDVTDSHYWLVTFSGLQPLRISHDLYEALDHFNGRDTNDAVLARLEEEKRIVIKEELLVHMYQFRLVTEPGRATRRRDSEPRMG